MQLTLKKECFLFILGLNSTRRSEKFDCCPEKYTYVLFFVHIRRRTLYFIFNFVFPCILISLMAILGFALPSDSGEVTIILDFKICIFYFQFSLKIIKKMGLGKALSNRMY